MNTAARHGVRGAVVAIATSVLLIVGLISGGAPAFADAGDAAFTTTPTPSFSTPVVNSRSGVAPGTWVPTPDSYSFQWFENGIAIGANYSQSPVFGSDDQGEQITVAVTATKAGYASQTETSAPVTVLGAITAQSVAIDGVPKPGETLTADGTFDPSDSTVTYQWQDQSGWISGATSQTYVPTEAEASQDISVNIRVSRDGYQTTSFVGYARITYDTLQPPYDLLTWDVHIGSTVQAPRESYWFPQPTTLTYQWMRGSVDILGATSPTYIVTGDDVGSVLHVRETGSRADYPDVTWISPATTEVLADFDEITTPVIVGTPEEGVPLTVKEAPWTPAAKGETTEWFVNGVAAAGDGGSFTPTFADIGATITAEVFGWSDTRASGVSPLSAPTAQVRANPYKLGTVKIGTVDLNRTVKVSFTAPPSGAMVAYQWLLNGSAISGATSATYKPEGHDWDKRLSVRVTVSGAGYATSGVTSNSELVRDGTIDPGTAQIVAGEQVRVGATLHAQAVGWAVAGTTVHFEWFDLDHNLLSYGSTYKVASSEYGHKLYLFAWGSAPHLGDTRSDGMYGNDYRVGPGLFSTHPAPTITGTANVGSTLTAHRGTWSPSTGVTFTYQWYRQASSAGSTVAIAHATHSTYTLTSSSAGQLVTVRVTAHKGLYTPTTATSVPTVVDVVSHRRTVYSPVTGRIS